MKYFETIIWTCAYFSIVIRKAQWGTLLISMRWLVKTQSEQQFWNDWQRGARERRRGEKLRVANMAALKPYQNALLENRDVLLRDVRTNDVCPLLYVSGVLTQKEIDDINIGRTSQERTESLLDLLHYKGPNGFQEFCAALEDTHPHLAAKLRAKNPQIEVLGKLLFVLFQ